MMKKYTSDIFTFLKGNGINLCIFSAIVSISSFVNASDVILDEDKAIMGVTFHKGTYLEYERHEDVIKKLPLRFSGDKKGVLVNGLWFSKGYFSGEKITTGVLARAVKFKGISLEKGCSLAIPKTKNEDYVFCRCGNLKLGKTIYESSIKEKKYGGYEICVRTDSDLNPIAGLIVRTDDFKLKPYVDRFYKPRVKNLKDSDIVKIPFSIVENPQMSFDTYKGDTLRIKSAITIRGTEWNGGTKFIFDEQGNIAGAFALSNQIYKGKMYHDGFKVYFPNHPDIDDDKEQIVLPGSDEFSGEGDSL